MSLDTALVLGVVSSSFVVGIAIFALHDDQVRARTVLNMAGALIKVALLVVVFLRWFDGHELVARLPFLPGVDLVLRVDQISLLFVSLSAVLWLLTTVYAIGYMENAPHRSRFFGFFSLSVTATMGVALAGNMLTFFLFYELLTLVTYPLVVHRGTAAALRAGRTYLAYTIGGGAVLLIGVIWLQTLAGPVELREGGAIPAALAGEARPELIAIYALLVAGLGVKAALVPLHGWLPVAMIAPTPVSALLHAVAVVKAGAYGIVRVTYDVYGIDLALSLGVLGPLGIVAAATIVYGSLRALAQDQLKRRLAYSTVSQLSYIGLGVAIFGPLATTGALVHLVHQGLMKITLFFCAGALAETLGIHRISEMAGVGRRMPLTMGAFTLAACGMIGLPPLAGFFSKWYLGTGGLAAGEGWVVAVLALSSVLNAAYFLPIVGTAWFGSPRAGAGVGARVAAAPPAGFESKWTLLAPTLACALLVLAVGLFAGAPFSPLSLAHDIAEGMYPR